MMVKTKIIAGVALLALGMLLGLAAGAAGEYHNGSGDVVEPKSMDPATGAGWEEVLKPLEGQGWSAADMEKQLGDYLSPSKTPSGVDYPSIKDVPMFNEAWVEGIRLDAPTLQETDGTNSYSYTAEVTVGLETWFPFPSTESGSWSYWIAAPTVTMQSGEGSGIWIPVALRLPSGEILQVTQETCAPDRATVKFQAAFGDGKPNVHEFKYSVQFQTEAPVAEPDADLVLQSGWETMDAIDMMYAGWMPVDRLPKGVKYAATPQILRQGEASGRFSVEATDPRLNHLAGQWQQADNGEGSPGEINRVTREMAEFQKAGPWMHCRSGEMQSLAEFGGFSAGKPWMTLDLCTDGGREALALGMLEKGEEAVPQEPIRAWQLLRTALGAAQTNYSEALWNAQQYLPDKDYEVFTSEASGMDAISGSGGTLAGSGVKLLRGEVLDWIPARYMTKAVSNIVNDANWILVREKPGMKSRILGRYAYVCFDCSGGLDANFVALDDYVGKSDVRAVTERKRRSVRDVPMGLLPELAVAGAFKSYRRGWKGFDNLPMLRKLTDGVSVDGNGGHTRWQVDRKEDDGPGLVPQLVSDLVPYSLSAYRGGRYSRSSATWKMPVFVDPMNGSGWKWATTSNIGNPVPNSEDQLRHIRSHMPSMLKDFTSQSVEPAGVDYPSVKNIPMFNEVIMKKLKLYKPTLIDEYDRVWEFKATVEFQFEFWYPFPGNTYTINGKKSPVCDFKAPTLSMASYPDGIKDIGVTVALLVNGKRVMLQESFTTVTSNAAVEIESLYNGGQPFTKTVKYETKFKGVELTEEEVEGSTPMLWCRGWQTQQDIDLKHNDTPVDRLPKGLAKGLNVQVAAGGDPDEGKYSMEVCDPRLNHDKDEWQSAEEGTPGEINECTKSNQDFQREGAAMYCRNGPLESPADFGFLSVGKPWKTIDLLCERGVEFLAGTTVDTNLYEHIRTDVFYTNAQLNVNTRCSNALATVFYGISTIDVPGWDAKDHEGVSEMDEDEAREVAEYIMHTTAKEPFQSGMDWAGIVGLMGDNGWLADRMNMNRNQRESLLRNTYGLFSVADNLFTVVVVVQTVKEGEDKVGTWDDGDQITGERWAVALVWRDPFRVGDNPQNEMMVRAFRSLTANDGTPRGVEGREDGENGGEQ